MGGDASSKAEEEAIKGSRMLTATACSGQLT